MPASMPIPTFEDIRKLLQFWIDQQDKWFYFETNPQDYGTDVTSRGGLREVPPIGSNITFSIAYPNQYQERIIGKVSDALSFPPSLLLRDAKVLVAKLQLSKAGKIGGHDRKPEARRVSVKDSKEYALVFSRIHYFERIRAKSADSFMSEDPRWVLEEL